MKGVTATLKHKAIEAVAFLALDDVKSGEHNAGNEFLVGHRRCIVYSTKGSVGALVHVREYDEQCTETKFLCFHDGETPDIPLALPFTAESTLNGKLSSTSAMRTWRAM
jgi:hypothetical protein